jgi:hypothetical protein
MSECFKAKQFGDLGGDQVIPLKWLSIKELS